MERMRLASLRPFAQRIHGGNRRAQDTKTRQFDVPRISETKGYELSRVAILGGLLTPLDLDGTVRLLLDMVRDSMAGYLCIANVHTTTLSFRDLHFREALNGATAVVADGMPVVWGVRAAGHPQAGRVYGADLVEATCLAGAREGISHGFLGGLPGVAEAMVANLRARYPGLRVAGIWDPGIIAQGETAPAPLLDAINQAAPDILWVGLGAPKQEVWMAQHRPYLQRPILVGVGQAFDLLAGLRARPPEWMGHCGLEWLYRLAHEPRRLWKRYLVYNSLFLWYLIRERLGYGLERMSIDHGDNFLPDFSEQDF